MEAQVESAVEIAFNPMTEPGLKSQAHEFLHRLRDDPDGWQIGISLFARTVPPPSEVVRLVCLEVVNNAVQTQRLGPSGLTDVRFRLTDYVRRRYGLDASPADADTPSIQNKLTQALTYLFTSLYPSGWTDFIDEFVQLSHNDGGFSPPATILLLRILSSLHDEIADVMIPRTPDEQKRCTELKDLVRKRDVVTIARLWQDVLSRWRQLDLGLVEMALRTVAKWVSWIDVSLVINERIQTALLEIAGQHGTITSDSKEAKARDAAIDTLTETVAKKMGSTDKIDLINYLNLGPVVGQLIASPGLSELRSTSNYDTDLAETVARLVNNVVFDVVKALETDGRDEPLQHKAGQLLQTFVPYLLRFFADEYDEICSAVIPSLTDLLTMFRKQVKSGGGLAHHYTEMLQPILDAIIAKMKYDETANWGEEDDKTDEAEFQDLRKRLHVLQQSVAAVDDRLYMQTLGRVVGTTLGRLQSADDKPNWRDLDLALLEMHYFGELAIKNGGLYTKNKPSSEASRILVEMMSTMVRSGLASYPHPAVQLQYMEICVRYVQYFEQNPTGIPQVLENFVKFVHSNHIKVRARSWYLFQRFTRHIRAHLAEYAQTIVTAISDLLNISAELPSDRDDEDGSSDDLNRSADATFQSQLYLFEAIGTVASTQAVPTDIQVAIAKSVIDPLCSDLSQNLPTADGGDERAVWQAHHIIMALGTLANGFSDWSPGSVSGSPPPTELSQKFARASDGILTALERLERHSVVRSAARHAFSRLLGVLGSHVLPQLPRWIEGLLSSTSSIDEMAMFLRTLGQVVYGFKSEILDILDQLFSPLFHRVLAGLAQPITGTDDEIQLRELKQQYLNLLLVILNNDLGAVFVSPANQAVFDPFIDTLARFACDAPADPQSARLAFAVLTKMASVWGGPDIPPSTTTADDNNNHLLNGELAGRQPQPALAGFDGFLLSRVAPLSWTPAALPRFNAGDAQMRGVLHEAAALQWTVFRKTGDAYRAQLHHELTNLGVTDDGVRSYLASIAGDVGGFKKFFVGFVQQAKR